MAEEEQKHPIVALELPPPELNLTECVCRYFVDDDDDRQEGRKKSSIRAAMEQEILTDVAAWLEREQGRSERDGTPVRRLQYVSIGSGGLLQDWILVNAFTTILSVPRIDVHCIDIMFDSKIKNPTVRQRMEAFSSSLQATDAVRVFFYKNMTEFANATNTTTTSTNRILIDALVAIDVPISNCLSELTILAPNVPRLRADLLFKQRKTDPIALQETDYHHPRGKIYVAEQVNPKDPVICWTAPLFSAHPASWIQVQK